MSFTEKELELLEPEKEQFYTDFFEPNPVSHKRKSNILFADNIGNIHMTKTLKKPIIKQNIRRKLNAFRFGPIYEQATVLGNRKLLEAFGEEIYNDKERYGQDIPSDFFKTNIGHAVVSIDENEIIDWCYKYLASKKNHKN